MKRIFRIAPAVLLTFAPAAFAQPMGPPHGGPGGPGGPGEVGHLMMLLHNVGLSDSQQQQVHALMDANRTQVEPLLEQLRTGHDSLTAKLYGTRTPALSDLTSSASQLSQLHAQVEAVEFQTVLKIRAVLTSDQLSRLSSLHDQLESLRQQTDALLKPTAPALTP